MLLKKHEKLETLIADYVVAAHKLQAKNKQLEKEMSSLKSELKFVNSKYERAVDSLKKTARLESVNQKMESDKTIIRDKVQGILSDLQQIDLI